MSLLKQSIELIEHSESSLVNSQKLKQLLELELDNDDSPTLTDEERTEM